MIVIDGVEGYLHSEEQSIESSCSNDPSLSEAQHLQHRRALRADYSPCFRCGLMTAPYVEVGDDGEPHWLDS